MNEARKKGKTERYDKKREFTACSKPLEGLVKRKKADLEGNEERFKSVFVTSPSAIVITDLDAKIVECNQAALEMNGCKSKGELIGKNAFELVAAKDRQKALENMEKTLQQHSIKSIEYTLLTKSGREFPAELSVSVVRDASGNPTSFVAIIDDITARKRIEEALTESERKYKNVIDNIGVGVAVINPRMEILALNKQMKKWFPNIDSSKKPICYRAFNNPPRKTLCSYCPTHKTLADGRTHESITESPRGKKTVNYRVISTPIMGAKNGKPVAAIEMVDDITERRQMEKRLEHYSKRLERLVDKRTRKLRESEEHFRSVADYASEAIITLDSRRRIVFWNKAAERIFGYSPGEAIGNSIELVVPKGLEEGRRRAMDHVLSTGKSNLVGKTFEFTGLGKDSIEIPVELSFSIWKAQNAMFFTAIVRDITERKETEKSMERLAVAFDCTIDGIAVVDINGFIQIVNPAWAEMHGYTTSELLGKHLSIFHTEDQMKNDVIPFNEKVLRAGSNQGEVGHVRKDGTVFPTLMTTALMRDEKGNPSGFVGTAKDTTESQKAKEALRESEERFRDIAINAGEWIWEVDREGRYVYSSPAVEQILGYKADEVIGKFFYDFLLPDEREQLTHAAFEKFKKKEPFAHFVNQNMRKDGHTVVLETYGVPILNPDGQLLGYRGSDRDITERRTVEYRLSALNSYGGLLNAAHSLEEVYELTLDAMELTLGFEHASFMTVERNCLCISCFVGFPKPLAFKLPLDGTKRGITVRAANTRKPVLVPDVRKDKDYLGTPLDMRSELAVPIIAEDKILGVLNVESKETNAFTEREVVMLQILASHAATAISNLEKRKEIEVGSNQLSLLMNSSAEMIHSTDLNRRLQAIVNAICRLGWRRVVLSVRNETLNIERPEDIVTAGLTDKEREYLWINRQPGQVWTKRFGQEYQRFRISEFYHLPWSDPWVRRKFSKGTVLSKLTQEDMIDWNPEDLLYAPLKLADGRIIGVVSMDDPSDGKRPTRESMQPLELFLNQAAVAIENAQLFEQLKTAKTQLQEHADQLEEKVEMKTEQLKETQAKLLKSERLAAIGELAGMVGHDLRNPLTGIAGATYYLRTRVGSKLGKKAEEMLCLIEKNIEHSDKIINDLLEYSREIRLDLTETTPRMIMKETLSLIKTPRRIRIVNATRTKPRIKVDEEKMRRVFINIIKNAFDAMPEGGTLKIKSKKLGDNIEFTFSDTGVGMPEETLQKLWTPLFTTKAKGMGFGLPICKRIAEAHGGRVTVDSTVGKGTTFKVTLSAVSKTVGGEKIWMNVPESLLSMTMKV
ncbi:PAS domain S-box protein [Candidatus Bathyarchaeota archaeon]|nr:PAS domain S-box protein [Candidatus Bathyarchaeota archaeon]